MAEPPRKPRQTVFGTGERQTSLVQFTPEEAARLEERGIVVPPQFVPRKEAPPPRTLQVPTPLVQEAPILPNLPVIPSAITEYWHVPHTLREYQAEAFNGLLAAHRGSVFHPPGSGKTTVAVAAIVRLKTPTVIIVPSKILLDQWREELARAGIKAGTYYGDEKHPGWVTVATYQSLFSYPAIIRKFPFIIFDEADLATAPEFRALLEEADRHPYALAVTGTRPHSTDRMHYLESKLPTLSERSLGEIGETGHVVVPAIHKEAINLLAGEMTEYERVDKVMRNASRRFGGGGPEAALRATRSPNRELAAAGNAYLKAFQERRRIVNGARNKVGVVVRIVQAHPGQRILLFAERIEALEAVCSKLREVGVPCRLLTGKSTPYERREILENWGRTFWVLASAKVLERGFNVPEVSLAIVLASGSSAQQILQRFGRIARPAPGKTRADAYVIYARNTFEEELPGRMRDVIEEG